MPTIDAQVHAYERNHPGRPWAATLAGPPEVTGDQMVAAMDEVGVDGAILVSPFIPTLAGKLWEQIGVEAALGDQRWSDLAWGGLPLGTVTKKLGPVYPRIEDELAAGKKK